MNAYMERILHQSTWQNAMVGEAIVTRLPRAGNPGDDNQASLTRGPGSGTRTNSAHFSTQKRRLATVPPVMNRRRRRRSHHSQSQKQSGYTLCHNRRWRKARISRSQGHDGHSRSQKTRRPPPLSRQTMEKEATSQPKLQDKAATPLVMDKRRKKPSVGVAPGKDA